MQPEQDNYLLAFREHNHHQCEQSLLDKAKKICDQRDVRLTRRRRQVLEILLSSHKPMGAYEVLNALNKTEQNITPPIVYRALEFLLEQGLVHRIESENAFIPCSHPGHQCEAQFLICSSCHCVAELSSLKSPAVSEADKVGFKISHSVIEISGVCATCRK